MGEWLSFVAPEGNGCDTIPVLGACRLRGLFPPRSTGVTSPIRYQLKEEVAVGRAVHRDRRQSTHRRIIVAGGAFRPPESPSRA